MSRRRRRHLQSSHSRGCLQVASSRTATSTAADAPKLKVKFFVVEPSKLTLKPTAAGIAGSGKAFNLFNLFNIHIYLISISFHFLCIICIIYNSLNKCKCFGSCLITSVVIEVSIDLQYCCILLCCCS